MFKYVIIQTQQEFAQIIQKVVEKKFGINVQLSDIEIDIPKELHLGDLTSNIAFKLAKQVKQSPIAIAETIAFEINQILQTSTEQKTNAKQHTPGGMRKVAAVSGFLNAFVLGPLLQKEIENIIDMSNEYGTIDVLRGKKYEFEHTSPNPNKALHLGHLRNNVTSMAVGRILQNAGANIVYEAVDNNRGIAITKAMYGYLKHAYKNDASAKNKQDVLTLENWYKNPKDWLIPADVMQKPDWFVMDYYVKGANLQKENKRADTEIRAMTKLWEEQAEKLQGKVSLKPWSSKIHPVLELWRVILNWVYIGQNETLDRLGSRWDNVWHEHEHYYAGKKWVEKGLKQGVFKQSNGAVVTNLEKYNIPDTVVLKSDGTSLYITQDIALTDLKVQKWHADKYFWVVGSEQALALKQMFAVCEMLGIGKFDQFVHLAYGYVSIRGQGKMSSRQGNVILTDTLLDLAKEKMLDKLKDRKDITQNKKQKIAENLAVSAVKYTILKVGRNRDIAFDIDEALSLEGNSAPYVIYAYVRTKSLLRKAKANRQNVLQILSKIKNSDFVDLHSESWNLIRKLVQIPVILESATRNYDPSTLVEYLYSTVKQLNALYEKVKFVGTDNIIVPYVFTIWFEKIAKIVGLKPVEQM